MDEWATAPKQLFTHEIDRGTRQPDRDHSPQRPAAHRRNSGEPQDRGQAEPEHPVIGGLGQPGQDEFQAPKPRRSHPLERPPVDFGQVHGRRIPGREPFLPCESSQPVSSFDDLDKEGSAILTVDGLLTAFRTIDVQEKGRLDLVGFTMVLDEVGLVWSKAETQERFERADTNHDGYITFDELQRMLDDL
jgi:hypothetical protein